MAEVTPLPDSVSQAGSSVPSEGNSAEKQDIDVGQSTDTNSNSKDLTSKTDEVTQNAIGDDETDGDVNKAKLEKTNNLQTENEQIVNSKEGTPVQEKDDNVDAEESLIDEEETHSNEEVTGTETQTEGDEEGFEINDSDIMKATDVFGKGKRPRVKKMDGDFTDDYETSESTPHRYSNRKSMVISEEQRELLLKPFNEGWKREVVFRSTYSPVTKQGTMKSVPADVYYHPPEGRKLRSMVDITKHLVMTNSELTLDNFSFIRKPILEPPFEVVRSSGSVGRGGFGSPKTPRQGLESKPQVVIERDGEEKVLSEGGRISGSQVGFIRRKRGRPSSGINKSLTPRSHIVRKRGRPPKSVKESMQRENSTTPKVESNDSSFTSEPSPKRYKPTARKSTTPGAPKIFKVAKPPDSSQSLEELCNLHCPGRNMVPPSLQCIICLCLFHPECVNTNNDIEDFVCLRCVTGSTAIKQPKPASTMKMYPISVLNSNGKTIKATVVSQQVKKPAIVSSGVPLSVSTGVPPLSVSTNVVTTPKVTVKQEPMDVEEYSQAKGKNDVSETTLGSLKSVLDKRSVNLTTTPMPVLLNTFSGSQASFAFNGHSPTISSPAHTTVINSRPAAFTAIPNLSILNPLQGAAIISHLNPSSVIRPPTAFPSTNVSSFPSVSPISQPPPKLTAAPTPKSSPSTNGGELTQTTKNGQLLTLPSAVSKRLNLKQPLALKINNMQITVPPSCLLLTGDGLKVFLPPKTFPVQLGETAKLSVTVTNDKSSPSSTKISVNIGDVSSPKNDTPESKSSRSTRHWKSGINPGNCHIKKLYGGFDCMLCIFEYLNMHDLARVSLVCRTWRNLAQNPILWRDVKLRNVKVMDWKKAVKFLLRRAVHSLNLRGLEHYENRNHTWHQFLSVVPQLTCVQNIHFGLVPGSILQHVCEKMPHLEVFTAEWISDYDDEQKWDHVTKLNIGKFSSLPQLTELKLRGVAGLAMPSYTLSGGLDDLSSLTQLKKLSLTTLAKVEETDFSFLEKMEQLECLELGDCLHWTSKMYSLLANLKNLRTLRLENGGNIDSDQGLGEALSQIKSLQKLELIMYVVPESMKGLDHIKTLVVWPNTQESTPIPARVNFNMFKLVTGLQSLERLEWGIMNNTSTSIILENETSSTKWIPILPKTQESSPGGTTTVEYISVLQFTSNLTKALPNTRIKVYNSKIMQFEDKDS